MTTQAMNELKNYRASIDNLDAALIHILAERFRITKAVGELKARHELPRQIRNGRKDRSSGFARWRSKPILIPTSRRNS